MKKIIYLLVGLLLLTGCSSVNENKALKKFKDKAYSKSYSLSGNLIVNNSDNIYKYDVSVKYKNNMYRVKLLNKDTKYSQIILKNKNGVYVITHRSLQQKII